MIQNPSMHVLGTNYVRNFGPLLVYCHILSTKKLITIYVHQVTPNLYRLGLRDDNFLVH